MRSFLMDGMLVGLARRLRLMGYDCETAEPGEGGLALDIRALNEARILVSVSRARPVRAPIEVYIVPASDLTKQIRSFIRRYPIDVERMAFTRCSRDNTPLEQVAIEEVIARLPPKVIDAITEVRRCPRCGRLYWAGTHVERIKKRMAEYLREMRDEKNDE